uniref:Uncharacterized protein n=1 Tax=Oryza punctata TaxID=4537 RepID=A0A0E0KBZ0_ORYPU
MFRGQARPSDAIRTVVGGGGFVADVGNGRLWTRPRVGDAFQRSPEGSRDLSVLGRVMTVVAESASTEVAKLLHYNQAK